MTDHRLAKSVNPFGAQEIVLHERLDRLAGIAGILQGRSNLGLMLVRQDVSVPPREEMQVVSQSEQEILCIENLLQLALGQQPVLSKLRHRLISKENAPNPTGSMEVSKSTRSFLDVGFKLVDRVVKSLVTLSVPVPPKRATALSCIARESAAAPLS